MTASKCWLLPAACGLLAVLNGLSNAQEPPAANPYTVAVYWWPNFHCDAFHQSKNFPGLDRMGDREARYAAISGHAQPKYRCGDTATRPTRRRPLDRSTPWPMRASGSHLRLVSLR